jgi:hypothetical protein
LSTRESTRVRVCAAAAAGGFEYDGTTEILPLQASTDAAQAAEIMLVAGASAAAVCGVHSPLNPSQEVAFAAELQVALQQRAPGELQLLRSHWFICCYISEGDETQICSQLSLPLQRAVVIVPCLTASPTAVLRHMQQTIPVPPPASLFWHTAAGRPVHITLSHKLSGRLGLLERESAAVLNASLAPLAAAVIPQNAAALQQLGLHVPLYVTGRVGEVTSAAAVAMIMCAMLICSATRGMLVLQYVLLLVSCILQVRVVLNCST